MKFTTASDLRANLAAALDAIEDDVEALVVTRNGHEPMVMIPMAEYSAWQETEYLLRGANGRELRRRIADLEAGRNTFSTAAGEIKDDEDHLASERVG
jgi:antitoxin YefM